MLSKKRLYSQVTDKGFELLADHNDMGGRIIASPVPIRGGLLIRGDELFSSQRGIREQANVPHEGQHDDGSHGEADHS